MLKLICGISLIFFSTVNNVNSLQCYQCLNCTKVTEDQLVTCGESTTVSPTTTPSGQTTTSTQMTTVSGQTTTPGQTTAPGQTTIPSGTTQSTTSSALDSTSTETSIATNQTLSSQTTTLETSVENNSSDRNGANNFIARRVKREAVTVQATDNEYVCLTVKYKENSIDVVSRFCQLDTSEGKVCEFENIVNATCTACKTDKCNSAVSIQVSLMLVFAAIIFKFI